MTCYWALRGGGGNFGVITSSPRSTAHEVGEPGVIIGGPVLLRLPPMPRMSSSAVSGFAPDTARRGERVDWCCPEPAAPLFPRTPLVAEGLHHHVVLLPAPIDRAPMNRLVRSQSSAIHC